MRYDVALSFAGEDRQYVEAIANILSTNGVRVFYDKHEEAQLWGKNLYTHLSDVYSNQARYTIIFISKCYAAKLWANHERESAQARAFQENREYLLPARFDDTLIAGISSTIAYIDLRGKTPEEFSRLVEQKLRDNSGNRLPPAHQIVDLDEKYWRSRYKDSVLIDIYHPELGFTIAFAPAAYQSFHALLDDLFTRYLYQFVSPLSYGAEWVLCGRVENIRVACPLDWVVNPGKPITELSLPWTIEARLDDEGFLPGTWWAVDVNKNKLTCHRYCGLLTNNLDLVKLVLSYRKAYAHIVSLAEDERDFSFISLSEAREKNFKYQLVLKDWVKLARGKILVDRGVELPAYLIGKLDSSY